MNQQRILRVLLASVVVATMALPVPAFGAVGDRRESSAVAAGTPGPGTAGGVQVVRSDADGVTFEVRVPAVTFTPQVVDGALYQSVAAAGYHAAGAAGRPAVPVRGWLIGVPPGAEVTLTSEALEVETRPGMQVVPATEMRYTVPAGELAVLAAEPVQAGGAVRDAGVYAQDAYWPAASAALDAPARWRDLETRVVTVYPVRVNPVQGTVQIAQRVRVTVSFAYPHGRPAPQGRPESAVWVAQAARTVLNWEQAQAWRDAPARDPQACITAPEPGVRVSVNRDGLYYLTYAALSGAGLPAGQAVDALKLRAATGSEVRIRVVEGGTPNAQFDGTDYVLFWGLAAVGNKYSRTNAYTLTYGAGTGLRMTTLDATPGAASVAQAYSQTLMLEQNHLYRSQVPANDTADHWYWDYIYSASNSTHTYPVTLTARIANANAVVALKVFGYESGLDHSMRVSWNGTALTTTVWGGQSRPVLNVTVPGALINEGVNTVSLTALPYNATDHYVFLDWLSVEYRHAFSAENNRSVFRPDATGSVRFSVTELQQGGAALDVYEVGDPANVRQVINWTYSGTGPYTVELQPQPTAAASERYTVQGLSARLTPAALTYDTPSSLKSNCAQTDYILITADAFMAQVQPLAAARQAQGLNVRVVSVQDVYDEFSGGVVSAQAIRDFLAWAYANWNAPAPTYVLLFGDGTFDPQGYCQVANGCTGINGQATLLPAYLTAADPNIYETAADHCYVASGLCGLDNGHSLPLMSLGRIPALTASEAVSAVNKLVAYQSAPGGAWRSLLINTCDNGVDSNGNVDLAGNFYLLCDAYASSVASSLLAVNCLYYAVYAAYQNRPCYLYSEPSAAPDLFTDTLVRTINNGASLVTYTGHSNFRFVAHEHLIDLTDVDRLTNVSKPVWWYPMTCYEGYYIFPGLTSIAEKLLFYGNGGSIGSYSPTGLDVVSGHEYLRAGMTEELLSGERHLGVLTDAGRVYLWTNSGGSFRHLMETYMLIGDPATPLAFDAVSSTYGVYLPSAMR